MTSIMIQADDVNILYPSLRLLVEEEGVTRESRGGPVLSVEQPVMWALTDPMNRVLFSRPKANPFFHLYEAMWMLAGQELVSPLAFFIPSIKGFTDDGVHVPGAYGLRWQTYGQLTEMIRHLRGDPTTRRGVISHWDLDLDLEHAVDGGNDVPCNTHLYLTRRSRGQLDMTICNRSNDLLWGAMGANVVHFSFLLEYISEQIRAPMGTMYTMSNDLHMYKASALDNPLNKLCTVIHPTHLPLGSTATGWHTDLKSLIAWSLLSPEPFHYGRVPKFQSTWFRGVVGPMMSIYARWNDGSDPVECMDRIHKEVWAADWQRIALLWMGERV